MKKFIAQALDLYSTEEAPFIRLRDALLGQKVASPSHPDLLIVRSSDPQPALPLDGQTYFELRTPGTNLFQVDFELTRVLALESIAHVVWIAQAKTAYHQLEERQADIAQALVSLWGWSDKHAERESEQWLPLFSIADPQDFIWLEAQGYRQRFPGLKTMCLVWQGDHYAALVDG
jgi:hypothetical protein